VFPKGEFWLDAQSVNRGPVGASADKDLILFFKERFQRYWLTAENFLSRRLTIKLSWSSISHIYVFGFRHTFTSIVNTSTLEGQDIQQNHSYEHGNLSIINTSVLSEEEYVIQSETNINQTQLTLVNTPFSPNVPTTSVENGIVAEFESTRSTRYIAANIRGNSKVNRTTFIINRSRTNGKLVNISESGDYNITFINVNTGNTANKSVTVLKRKILNQISRCRLNLFLQVRYSLSISHLRIILLSFTLITQVPTPQ